MIYKKKRTKPLTKKAFLKASGKIIRNMQATTKPFADSSEAARKARVERATSDYNWFCTTYLPHYFFKPNGEIHNELCSYADTGGKSINAIAFPREHGKSAHASFGKPLWKALCGHSKYSIILSDTGALGEEFISWIKIECEENLRLIQDFGELVTPNWWRADDIVILNKCRIRGMGHQQKVRGTRYMQHRPEYIVIDDLENNTNVRNKRLVRLKLDWILGSVYGSMSDQGTLLMVGTMLDANSVLSNLVEHIQEKADEFRRRFKIKGMNAVVYSAIIDEGTEVERALWPEGKSLAKLKQIKFMVNPTVWASEFQNRPLDTGVYKMKWMQPYDRGVVFSVPSEWMYFSGSDPSARDGEQADYKAHCVIARKPDDKVKRYVAEVWARKTDIASMNEAFLELYEEYQMMQSAFEINGFQLYIQEDLAALCESVGYHPNFKLVTNKTDKVFRCGSWASTVKRGNVFFEKEHSDQELLMMHLNNLGEGDHDDAADAFDMAMRCSMTGGGKFSFRSSGKRRFGGKGGMVGNMRERISRMIGGY